MFAVVDTALAQFVDHDFLTAGKVWLAHYIQYKRERGNGKIRQKAEGTKAEGKKQKFFLTGFTRFIRILKKFLAKLAKMEKKKPRRHGGTEKNHRLKKSHGLHR